MSPLTPAVQSKAPVSDAARGRASADDGFRQLVARNEETGLRQKLDEVRTVSEDLELASETAGAETEDDGRGITILVSPEVFTLPDRFASGDKTLGDDAGSGDDGQQKEAEAGTGTGGPTNDTSAGNQLLPAGAGAAMPNQPRQRLENKAETGSVRDEAGAANAVDVEGVGVRSTGRAVAGRDGQTPEEGTGSMALPANDPQSGSEAARQAAGSPDAQPANAARSAAVQVAAGRGPERKTELTASHKSTGGGEADASSTRLQQSEGVPVKFAKDNAGDPNDESRRGAAELPAREAASDRKAATPAAITPGDDGAASAAKTPAAQSVQPDLSAARPATAASVANSVIDAVRDNANWSTFLKAPTAQYRETTGAQGQVIQALKVQLHPAELGALTLNLRAAGNRIVIDIKAEHQAAHRLAADGLDTVAKSFQALGYQVDHVNLTSSDGQSASLGQWGASGRERSETEGQRQDGGYPNRNAPDDRSAPGKSHDERASGRSGDRRALYI